MKYNEDAQLDTSGVQDARRGGGRLAAGGGGLGVVGLIIYLIVSLAGGSSETSNTVTDLLGQLSTGGSNTVDNSQVASECKTGSDANTKLDCAVVADIDSIQNYWRAKLPDLGAHYTDSPTVWFSGQVSTGCGNASSGAGPFYCPADKKVYLDLTFYDDLQTKFGAQGGLFVDAYVLAHEYGHHVQDLLGVEVRTRQGPTSDSVRLELQADCYAGVWAHHATTVPDATGQPLISDVTPDDIARALDTAGRIGDDFIEKNLGNGTVDPGSFTHGTSAQRKKWFSTGYDNGEPKSCDTFGTDNLG